jgi:hypothetical protein
LERSCMTPCVLTSRPNHRTEGRLKRVSNAEKARTAARSDKESFSFGLNSKSGFKLGSFDKILDYRFGLVAYESTYALKRKTAECPPAAWASAL